MKRIEFDAKMRALEFFHNLKAPVGNFIIIRVDGRGFSKLTAKNYCKPFDIEFRSVMQETALALMNEFKPIYGYFESDEISLLFPADYNLFDREVEKLVSVSAGVASSAFTKASGLEGHFDSRLVIAPNEDIVIDYFLWRQNDAFRNCINTICYWEQVLSGMSKKKASNSLLRATIEDKNNILHNFGITVDSIPSWQKYGVGVYNEIYEKIGFNPKTQETVKAMRNRWKVEDNLPNRWEYGAFIYELLEKDESEKLAMEARD